MSTTAAAAAPMTSHMRFFPPDLDARGPDDGYPGPPCCGGYGGGAPWTCVGGTWCCVGRPPGGVLACGPCRVSWKAGGAFAGSSASGGVPGTGALLGGAH